MADILLSDLTEGTVAGSGTFDVLMQTVKKHLDEEYKQGRIKGSDYSTVYLGSLTAVLEQASSFLLAKEKVSLETQLMEQQILLAEKEVEKANAQIALVQQQTENALAELQIILANASKVSAEVALLGSQKLKVDQDTANSVIEGANLVKQGCLLDAQYDLTLENKLKTAAESTLLTQKLVTERAQTVGSGVDDNSIVGRQRLLYKAQADGFKRDAEQKASRIMTEAWQVRMSANPELTTANVNNKLDDPYIGQVITKMINGLNEV